MYFGPLRTFLFSPSDSTAVVKILYIHKSYSNPFHFFFHCVFIPSCKCPEVNKPSSTHKGKTGLSSSCGCWGSYHLPAIIVLHSCVVVHLSYCLCATFPEIIIIKNCYSRIKLLLFFFFFHFYSMWNVFSNCERYLDSEFLHAVSEIPILWFKIQKESRPLTGTVPIPLSNAIVSMVCCGGLTEEDETI